MISTGICRWLFLVVSLSTWIIETNAKEMRVVCYYTNWSAYRPGAAKFGPQDIDPHLCTHLIYAFGGFTKNNTLTPFDKGQDIENGGYAKFNELKTQNKNLKTLLSLGGWNEGSARFSLMAADPNRREELVKNAIKFLRKNRFDGLDLVWQYPTFRDGGNPRDKESYANLTQELSEGFERDSKETRRPRLLLTMAVPTGEDYVNKGFDVPKLTKYLDWMNLLCYDYHSPYEPAVNHHAPLFPLEEDNEYNFDGDLNIDHTVKYYLKLGAEPSKLVLGIPTYGRSYTLSDPDAFEIGSPADGPGTMGEATRENGYLAYYEICDRVKNQDWKVVQPNPDAMGLIAFKDNEWVGYDDESIVRKKAEYADENGLGGIMFWAIDIDDFKGTCHGKPYPLIEAGKEALSNAYNTKEDNLVELLSIPSKTTSTKNSKLPSGKTLSENENVEKLSSGSRKKNRKNSNEEEQAEKPFDNSKSRRKLRRKSSPRTTTTAPPSTPDLVEDDYEYEDDDEEEDTTKSKEEDPRVLNKLIDLIRNAGGFEELEKQLRVSQDSSAQTNQFTTQSVLSKTSKKTPASRKSAYKTIRRSTTTSTQEPTEEISSSPRDETTTSPSTSTPGSPVTVKKYINYFRRSSTTEKFNDDEDNTSSETSESEALELKIPLSSISNEISGSTPVRDVTVNSDSPEQFNRSPLVLTETSVDAKQPERSKLFQPESFLKSPRVTTTSKPIIETTTPKEQSKTEVSLEPTSPSVISAATTSAATASTATISAPISSGVQISGIKQDSDSKLMNEALKVLQLSVDLSNGVYFVYALNLANELRKYNPTTLAHVKHAVADIIFEADIGKYSTASTFGAGSQAPIPYSLPSESSSSANRYSRRAFPFTIRRRYGIHII